MTCRRSHGFCGGVLFNLDSNDDLSEVTGRMLRSAGVVVTVVTRMASGQCDQLVRHVPDELGFPIPFHFVVFLVLRRPVSTH